MNNQPELQKNTGVKISLLVACYNEEKSLRKSIRSCLNQTRKFDEMVFVDDSSVDKTPEILNKFAHNEKFKR